VFPKTLILESDLIPSPVPSKEGVIWSWGDRLGFGKIIFDSRKNIAIAHELDAGARDLSL
jgi:hypothetical protein